MAALVDWATYYKITGDVFYVAVVPLTTGDWTDIVMPTGVTGLLMKIDWEDDVTLSKVDKTGASEVESIFHVETDGAGCYTFGQDIVQDDTGVNFRILDTGGAGQDVCVSVRAITK